MSGETPPFPLPTLLLPENIEDIVDRCWQRLGSRRSYIIAVDGRDLAGKSTLGRYLAFRMEMSCLSTDDFLLPNQGFQYRPVLEDVLRFRLSLNRPLIIEGVFVADTLQGFGLRPNYLIRVEAVHYDGNEEWQTKFEDYEGRVEPNERVRRLDGEL